MTMSKAIDEGGWLLEKKKWERESSMPKRRLVIIALLRVFRFQMNFYSGQSRFVEDKKRKEKKGEEIPNLKTHVEAIRNSMVKSCGMKRPRILLGIRFHNFFFHIQNATVFSFSRSFPFPSFFHSFFTYRTQLCFLSLVVFLFPRSFTLFSFLSILFSFFFFFFFFFLSRRWKSWC